MKMRTGEIDPVFVILNQAQQNLLHQLRRSAEPSADPKDLAEAIDQFIDAKIAIALMRRF